MNWHDSWEIASYIVTVIGLPLAIFIFIWQLRRDKENDEYEVYQSLADNYQDFLKVALNHPDLKLFSQDPSADLTEEQRERMMIIFGMLTSLFERAYLLMYSESLSAGQLRRWRSWEDYMREWCQREDYRAALPVLLNGEDAEFSQYIRSLLKKPAA